jgi:hypothetical protein
MWKSVLPAAREDDLPDTDDPWADGFAVIRDVAIDISAQPIKMRA